MKQSFAVNNTVEFGSILIVILDVHLLFWFHAIF